ncbi:sensor histidine kinase [Chryseolinea lacunae]|uniref:Histidine kinase n=1 Tax=Chryseolinea lacunae TaxID=2801331 RepID=A0ABS1KRW2_9BACT|nr:histidine kinase [Chryseolinea lacunae]MBL0741992.1 histidine kinase [Chryseolinea lacunae]
MDGDFRLLFWNVFLDVLSPSGNNSSLETQDRQIRATVLLALVPVVVAFSFIIFIFYRKKREAFFKQTEAELKLSIAEVEIKALRAQITPHFIFNCLNSIHHFMHRNDIALAGEYLVKFSQLIRHVLETSSSKMIPLDDELTALRLYIQLEQLRLNNSFEFTIVTDPILQSDDVQVPSMLIQPFVENAIWHGLNNRGAGGKMLISLTPVHNMIKCVIEDNGHSSSHEGAAESFDLSHTIKKTSLGMTLIHDRLAMVNTLYRVNAGFVMEDILEHGEPSGKRVELLIPFEA